MNEDKILVPLDDYEEKAKDQRTVEIIRDMVIREGDVAVNTLAMPENIIRITQKGIIS